MGLFHPWLRAWGSVDTGWSGLTESGFGCSRGSACGDKSFQCVSGDVSQWGTQPHLPWRSQDEAVPCKPSLLSERMDSELPCHSIKGEAAGEPQGALSLHPRPAAQGMSTLCLPSTSPQPPIPDSIPDRLGPSSRDVARSPAHPSLTHSGSFSGTDSCCIDKLRPRGALLGELRPSCYSGTLSLCLVHFQWAAGES